MTQEKETKRMIRLLESIAKIAQEASLTGVLKEGYKTCIRQYNAILGHLKKMEEIPDALFPPLEEDTSFDEIGVSCKQLVAYLWEEEVSPKGRLREATRISSDIVNINLKDLGELIHRAMPEWMKKGHEERKTEEEEPEKTEKQELNLNDIENRVAEWGTELRVMAERLRSESLSDDEIQQISEDMQKLGDKHAELAQKHATTRLEIEGKAEQ